MGNLSKCFFLEQLLNVSDDVGNGFFMVCFIVNVLFALCAIVGNLLVIAAVWKNHALHSPSNVLRCCLAFTDLGVGLIAQPLTAFFDISSFTNNSEMACIAGVLAETLTWLLSGMTFLTLCLMSAEMYLALYLHLRYEEFVTVGRTLKLYFLVWPLSLVVVLLRIWFSHEGWFQLLKSTVVFTFAGLCFVAIPFVYFKIFKLVRHHQMQIRALNTVTAQVGHHNHLNLVKYRKSLVANVAVLLTLYVCYLPFIVVEYLSRVNSFNSFLFVFHHVGATLILINSSLNPILLVWRLGEIRRAIWSVLGSVQQFWRSRNLPACSG